MSILEVNHIKKVYKTRMGGDEVSALRDVHLSVESLWRCWGRPAVARQHFLTFLQVLTLRLPEKC